MEDFRHHATSFLATRTNAPPLSLLAPIIAPVASVDLVERARDTCACAFAHFLSFGVNMLSAAERARARVLQLASASRSIVGRSVVLLVLLKLTRAACRGRAPYVAHIDRTAAHAARARRAVADRVEILARPWAVS